MSSAPELTGDELLAAELALGLLEGEALTDARRRQAAEPVFARAVEAWSERLAPLLAEVSEETPPAEVWDRIKARLQGREQEVPSNVVALRRKASWWRGYSAAVTAVAASLLVAIALQTAGRETEPAPTAAPRPAPSLIATLTPEQGPAALVATYSPDSRSIILAPAAMQAAAGHDHELWLIAPGGTPQSLGLVRAGDPQRLTVPGELAGGFGAEATLALSVEPVGGSPTGQPTGPVIASGKLRTV